MTLYACDRCGVVYLVVPVDAECRLALALSPSTGTHPAHTKACYGTVVKVPDAS